MVKTITLALIGTIISVLGIINMKDNVASIHWYNRRKVSEHDIPKYGKCIGMGGIIIGGSLIVSSILELAFQSDIFDYLILCGCFAGLAVTLYGQFKYNKGIF